MISTIKKINFLLSKRQRKGLVVLTFLLFVGMVLEAIGLGIILPILSVVLSPNSYESYEIFSVVKYMLPNVSNQELVLLMLLIIIVIYTIKTFFLVFLTFMQNKFLSNTIANITNKLFSSYLSQPYTFHIERNDSELLKNIQVETSYLYAFLLALITIIIESLLMSTILMTLIYIEPIGAISIGMFYGVVSLLFYRSTRKKLKNWGKVRQELDQNISKLAFEGLGGIKDLLISKRASFFVNRFSLNTFFKAKLTYKQNTLSQSPRFFLELIAVFGLISFIITMLLQDKPIDNLIATVGVFVAATFRMIPSLNRIIASNQSLKFYLASVNSIYTEIKSLKVEKKLSSSIKLEFNSCIEFQDVSFKYNDGPLILDNISLKIRKGEMIGLIGESGSGKSSLIDLLIGINSPTNGLIKIDNLYDISKSEDWSNYIGYVSQNIYLSDDSIRNNIAFGLEETEINELKVQEVIRISQLKEFIESLKNGLETKVGDRGIQLSGGQVQRIGLARALYNNPQVLVLDEATSALDFKTEKEVIESIVDLKGDLTIIMIAHRLTTLKSCDLIYEINEGKLEIFEN